METYFLGGPQEAAMRALGYADACRHGNVLYISGQLGQSPDTGLVAKGFEAQAMQAFTNVKTMVERAGGTAADIVQMMIFIAEAAEKELPPKEINNVLARAKQAILADTLPAGTGVTIKSLAHPAFVVEIQAIAHLGDRDG